MSILITGMEMPKEGFIEIVISENGNVQITGESIRIDGSDFYSPAKRFGEIIGKAVEIPEHHGRLIDADELWNKLDHCMFPSDMVTTLAVSMARNWILKSTTIIPATEEET